MLAPTLVLLILAFLLLLPIKVEFKLEINSNQQQVLIGFGPFKKRNIYRLSMPLEPKHRGLFYLEQIKSHIKKIRHIQSTYSDILAYAEKKLIIEDVHIKTHIGLSDAGKTAIFCGILINICDLTYQYLNSKFKIKTFIKEIFPIFNKNYIDMYVSCIMSMKTGHIIIIVYKIICSNIKKAVKHRWQTNIQ